MRECKAEFKNPKSEYRLAPFWFWNHDQQDDEIIWQVREMHRQGVGGFIIHARSGLITPYMSDEWMDRCETAVREAERLSMKVYLYDEIDFPSGSAGGRVTEDPELRCAALVISQEFEAKGDLVELDLDTLDGLVAVLAAPVVGGIPDQLLDLRDFVKENHLSWRPPEGRWLIMTFARKVWHEGYNRYLGDYMNPKATARFIELTHAAYRDRLGKHFGSTIVGIFTDEPAVNYAEPGVPWTGALPDEFSRQHGCDISLALPALFKDLGPGGWKLRGDFWAVVARLYSESFFGRIEEFGDSCDLKSIGHLSSEGELFLQARRQADYFRCAKMMHFGGADCLFSATWPPEKNEASAGSDWSDHNNLLALKFASSTAALYDKPRTMSESFGLAGQWGVNLRTLKWLTDWHIALGVNLLMPHAFYYTIAGFRRWEAPPGEFYQSTFWPHYRTYADYAGRLCSLFSGGEHSAEVAVLYPIKSLWTTDLSGSVPDDRARPVVIGLTEVTRALLRTHHDFHILPDELLQSASGTDTLEINGLPERITHRFRALVVPPCTMLDKLSVDRIKQFYDDGGMVILAGEIPDATTEAGQDRYPRDVFGSMFGGGATTVENANGGRAVLLPTVKAGPAFEEQLVEALEPKVFPQARITQGGKPVGDILCLKHHKADADFYFLANSSEDEAFSTEVRLGSHGKVELWDAETGDTSEIDRFEVEPEWTVLELHFEPTQSYVISVDKNSRGDHRTADYVVERPVLTLPDSWSFRTEKPNVLPITDWRVKFHAGTVEINLSGCPRTDLTQNGRIYDTEFQLGAEIGNARLLFPELIGQHCLRPFNLPFMVEVELNGIDVKDFQSGEYLDHFMKEAEVGHLLRKGTNNLIVRTKVELYDGGSLNHPVLLLGDFSLKRATNGWSAMEPVNSEINGSWTDFGYPFYSGTGVYSQSVNLPRPEAGERCFARFERVGDMAEVVVNGQSAGTASWEPFEVDITPNIRPGVNRFEIKVTNSLQNLLVLTPKPSGILGGVDIVARK